MKKFTFSFLLFLGIQNIDAQILHIQGELKNVPDNTMVTLIDGMANKVVDSAKPKEGKFELKAIVANTSIYVIGFSGAQQKIPVFVGNDNLSLVGDFKNQSAIEFKGSASHALYQSFMKTVNPKMEGYFKTMTAAQTEQSATAKDSLSKVGAVQSTDLIETYKSFSTVNKQSPVTTFFLLQFANIFPAIKDDLATYYAGLSGEAKKGPFAAFIDKSLESAQVGKIGSVLPEFKQNDATGKSISLSSFRGKYVLVDFWASWCGPCRAENPNVVKAFNTFKDKKFTVLGVSLDQDKAKWLDAVKKDGLTWTHVSDLKYWNNAVAVQFGIQSIPANFLLNPDGVIIAKDVRGEELLKILSTNIK